MIATTANFITRTLTSLSKFSKMNRDKIYFRCNESCGKVDINFLLEIKNGSWRQFNLSRNLTESLETVGNRIGINVQKFINKAHKKKAEAKVETGDIEFNGDNNSKIQGSLSCKELFDYHGSVKVKIFDSELQAIFNPPWVIGFTLPKTILAGFTVYPENLSYQFTEHNYNEFKWYVGCPINEKGNQLSDDHIQWIAHTNNFFFLPSAADIGKKVKLECIPGNSLMTGPSVEQVSANVIEAGPGECPFEIRHQFTKNKLECGSFRCVSYNILADLYCDSEITRTVLHPYCPPYALEIDYRKQLIVKELLGYNADLICLQEVDCKIFDGCLKPTLKIDGFDGCFYKKGKAVSEGLAVFFRNDKFRFITDKKNVLSNVITENCFADIWKSIESNQPLLDRLLDRSTAASATVLQSLDDENHILIVGNTHLYFHPDADHIRLIQGGMFIYWLQQLQKELKEQMGEKSISIVMCGDFNSVPSCGIYKLYTTGQVLSDIEDWKSNEAEAVKNLSLRHSLRLASACGTPQYTNFTKGFADCLDYIFYDTQSLGVEQVVPFPTEEELKEHIALPSIVFPSDHIAIIADLFFLHK